MTALALAHRLDRTLVIQARRETVFQFFTDTPQWAAWWGAGSTRVKTIAKELGLEGGTGGGEE